MFKRLLVTGGAGFMGSAFVRFALERAEKIVTLDLLTYAGNLRHLPDDPRHIFIHGDILNGALVEEIVRTHAIDAIVHFAAESHVDRSIEDPRLFYRTNVDGTISLLEVVRRFPWIHFHQISTDEVYGSIHTGAFTEESPYRPNSPYAASKAAADHFVMAYAKTYGLSTTISHSSNNYGPRQFPEKFIPRMIANCLTKAPLPLYGTGENVREWLFVEDHAEAVWLILQEGRRGERYNIGGGLEKRNIDLLHLLIQQLAAVQGVDSSHYTQRIAFVADRPGHDFRYALDCSKIERELGWHPRHAFEAGLDKTISWYVEVS